jgi:hypothetical protein
MSLGYRREHQASLQRFDAPLRRPQAKPLRDFHVLPPPAHHSPGFPQSDDHIIRQVFSLADLLIAAACGCVFLARNASSDCAKTAEEPPGLQPAPEPHCKIDDPRVNSVAAQVIYIIFLPVKLGRLQRLANGFLRPARETFLQLFHLLAIDAQNPRLMAQRNNDTKTCIKATCNTNYAQTCPDFGFRYYFWRPFGFSCIIIRRMIHYRMEKCCNGRENARVREPICAFLVKLTPSGIGCSDWENPSLTNDIFVRRFVRSQCYTRGAFIRS